MWRLIVDAAEVTTSGLPILTSKRRLKLGTRPTYIQVLYESSPLFNSAAHHTRDVRNTQPWRGLSTCKPATNHRHSRLAAASRGASRGRIPDLRCHLAVRARVPSAVSRPARFFFFRSWTGGLSRMKGLCRYALQRMWPELAELQESLLYHMIEMSLSFLNALARVFACPAICTRSCDFQMLMPRRRMLQDINTPDLVNHWEPMQTASNRDTRA
jgi:hypothetical protein